MVGKGRQVTIQFLGDARSLISATSKATKGTNTLSGTLSKVGKAALVGFATAGIAAGKVMYEFAEAAVEDEKSAALLARTLKNTTGATNAQVASVEDWISAQGKLYGVTDDDLRPALSKLAAATGSITKSQKLASLAMDVSAGTGKDLSSISLALAKAQNGSLAGLGRLGVATKDAAGQTKTLTQITDDLAKKYKGAASTAADTASGKFQRLKVDMSELGESIGYKLLPYANDLGDWLLKDGVPALESMAHSAKQELGPELRNLSKWVGDNKDDFADLGAELVQTVIPAVRVVGGVAGDAVRFFVQLPGPVKSLGAEAAVAAMVIPKLSAAISGVNMAVGLGTTKLAGWRKGLLLAAGVGGMTAMTKGAESGSKAVSVLGGALTGAFVGGSIGSAIPVIGTAVGALGGAAVGTALSTIRLRRSMDQAGQSAGDAVPPLSQMKDTLNQLSGASTRATRELILQRLEQDGIVEGANRLGIATSDLIKSTLGNQKAIERVNDAWKQQGGILDALQSNKINDWLAGQRSQFRSAQQAVKDHNAALNGTDRAASRAATSLETVGKQRPNTGRWAQTFKADLAGAQQTTVESTSGMRKMLSGEVGKARANMGPFTGNLMQQLGLTKGRANSAGVGIGNSIESGVHSGLGSLIGNVVGQVNAAIAAAQAAAAHHGGGGGKGGGSKRTSGGGAPNVIQGNFGGKGDYAQGLLDSYTGAGRKAEVAGSALLDGIVKGLKKGDRTLKNVMGGLQDYIQTRTDKLNEILGDRDSFVQTFRDAFSESIFSAQFSDADGNAVPPTLAKMLDFAKQQQANAKALSTNIKSLLAKGLSKDLIQQLVGQGQAGFDQIGALATGSQGDINQFNAINADVKATLEGLGTDLYNALNPNAQSQIDLLTTQVANGQAQIDALNRIADRLDAKDKIEIKGTDLVILLRHIEKANGKQLLATPA